MDEDRERVKHSLKYVLEEWVVHRRVARDSHVAVGCLNCGRVGMMNITYIEDSEPVKVTYQCRTCNALMEHECVLGKGRLAVSRYVMADSAAPLSGSSSPQFQLQRCFPDVVGYDNVSSVLNFGACLLSRRNEQSLSREALRVASILQRITTCDEPPFYWVTDTFLRKARATALPPGMALDSYADRWDSGVFLLPEKAVFSPEDGSCSFVAYSWQKAGRQQLWPDRGGSQLNLVDKLMFWAACPRTKTVFSGELNLGGRLDQITFEPCMKPLRQDNRQFCQALLKMILKLSLLLRRYPELVETGERMTRGDVYAPNWFGRGFGAIPELSRLGAGQSLFLRASRAIA